jgi:protein-L-isoaspartate(D-aspartate) O-methyltransferase
MPSSHEGLVELVARGSSDERVVEAFRLTDRAGFVPRAQRGAAYSDRPIPLPERQTTSQPSLIARMVEAVRVGEDDRVLEVGTGYGFQTAVLARLAKEVVSIERSEVLAEGARDNLDRAGIVNATVIVGDGWEGYRERAPYDAIVVSAAASEVPSSFVDQMNEGGRLVIPVASPRSDDVLLFVKERGALKKVALLTPARFVPLVPGVPGK